MEIQSLSVCVPGGCPNKCKFCVSRMRVDEYINQIEKNTRFRDLYKQDFKRRLMFARDNGCNTVVLTGQGEPLCNTRFLEDFLEWNDALPSPFRWIELQTSGYGLSDEKLRWLRNAGVSTISLSLSSLDTEMNHEYNESPTEINILDLCSEIKRYDFNLRISLNMTDRFYGKEEKTLDTFQPKDLFDTLRILGANQVTFRVLYESGHSDISQNKWIREHSASDDMLDAIKDYVLEKGRRLERLPFGAVRYSVNSCILDSVGGISTVVDEDCMSVESEEETIRYLILRPNCRLYTKWDDEGSLIF